MSVVVRRAAAELPELARAAWEPLEDADPGAAELCRTTLVAELEVLDNAIWVASSWTEDGKLRGIALAIEEQRASGARVLVVGMHFAMRLQRCTGLWFARGEDHATLAGALLHELLQHARSLGVAHMIVGFVPADHREVIEAGLALGARALDAPPEWRLELLPDETFPSFLTRLGYSSRRHWRRDLKACEAAGGHVTHTSAPPPAQLEQAWALQADTMRRKGTPLVTNGGNLFAAFARHQPDGAQALTACWRGETMLGFVTTHRTSAVGYVMGVGHVDGEPFLVLPAVMSHALRAAFDSGARQVLLGSTSDTYKQRFGCVATRSTHLVLRI
jgi:predicted N-acyltransferase